MPSTQPEGRLAKFVHNEIEGDTFGETAGNLAAGLQDYGARLMSFLDIVGERTFFPLIWVLLVLAGLVWYDGSYLYPGYVFQETLARENAGYSCICIYEGVGYYENLKEFTYYNKSLLLTPGELENRRDKESIKALERVALLVKSDEVDVEHILEIMEEVYGFVSESWGFRGPGVHGDMLCFMTKSRAE